jgi:hypothetical protein
MKTFINLMRLCKAYQSAYSGFNLYENIDRQLSHCVACNISVPFLL